MSHTYTNRTVRNRNNSILKSYDTLRSLLGWLAFLLPIIVLLVAWIFAEYFDEGYAIHGSVSHYYYSPARNIFVGTLIALGIFLIIYAGEDYVKDESKLGHIPFLGRRQWFIRLVGLDGLDKLFTLIAGFGAIGVALFPTTPTHLEEIPRLLQISGTLHMVSAAALFGMTGVISLLSFSRIRQSADEPDEEYRLHTYQYITFGYLILFVVVILMPAQFWYCADKVKPACHIGPLSYFLILEWVVAWCFGVVWYKAGQKFRRSWLNPNKIFVEIPQIAPRIKEISMKRKR